MNALLGNARQIGAAATLAILMSASLAGCQDVNDDRRGAVLKQVAEAPLPGPAVRFDYQSLDAKNGRLYIAHMNADQLVVFDTQKRQVVANLDGFRRVHGVIAVPEVSRVFASATGDHQMNAVDMNTLKIVGQAGPINYPDGLAYSPSTKRVSFPTNMVASMQLSTRRPTSSSPRFHWAEERETPCTTRDRVTSS